MNVDLRLLRRHLEDQLAASTEHSRYVLDRLADSYRGSLPTHGTSRGARAVLLALAVRVEAGLDRCEHLTGVAPNRAVWWLPEAPTILRCAPCAQRVLLPADGAPVACDACGQPTDRPALEAVCTAGLVRDRPGDLLEVVPPVLSLAHFCRDCAR